MQSNRIFDDFVFFSISGFSRGPLRPALSAAPLPRYWTDGHLWETMWIGVCQTFEGESASYWGFHRKCATQKLAQKLNEGLGDASGHKGSPPTDLPRGHFPKAVFRYKIFRDFGSTESSVWRPEFSKSQNRRNQDPEIWA